MKLIKDYSIYKHNDSIVGVLSSNDDSVLIINDNGDFSSKDNVNDSEYLSELSLISSHNSVLTMIAEFQLMMSETSL